MKNYINFLTEEELSYICRKIGGKSFREGCKKYSRQFNKIKPGFRPDSLSDEDAIAFAIKNKDAAFISDFLNFWISSRLKEIEDYKSNLRQSGLSEEAISVETLARSVFDAMPKIYYAVTEKAFPCSDQNVFSYAIKLSGDLEAACEKLKEQPDVSTEDELSKKHAEELNRLNQAHAEELNAAQEKFTSFQAEIDRLNAEIKTLQEKSVLDQEELNEYRALTAYRVTSSKLEPAEGYMYASLCSCYYDDLGRSRLFRFADAVDSEFSDRLIESAPIYTRLYRKDGPSRDGYIGVWSWRVVPNASDPEKDFIETIFNSDIHPIEVCIVPECQTIPEMIAILKTGIQAELHSDRVLFTTYTESDYSGIYCETNSLTIQGGMVTVKSGVQKLPVYCFKNSDMLHYKEAMILRYTGLDLPTQIVRVNDPIDIVRNRVIARTTWSVMQQRGFIKNEYRQVRDFLTEFSTDDFYSDISKSCDCSLEEARAYVDEFITQANAVMTGVTLENAVMAQIIRNDESLYQACLEELREDWVATNRKQIADAQAALDAVKAEESQRLTKCSLLNDEIAELNTKIASVQARLSEQERFAEEVETRVLTKINKARDNAAEFIAEQAFIYPNSRTLENPEQEHLRAVTKCFKDSTEYKSEDPDTNDTYNAFLQTLQNELLEAGVKESSVVALSALLYAAYLEHIPLLLVGPNGMDIAEAFSISLDCHYPSVLRCEGAYTVQSVTDCNESDAETTVIEYPFELKWRNAVVNLFAKRNKFIIALHPYEEDLIIEPKGLFNYCTPVFTDLFIDGFPTKNYIGGRLSDHIQHFERVEATKQFDKLLRRLGAGTITRLNIQKISANMCKLLNTQNNDADYLMLLYPIAYVLGELPALSEQIANDSPVLSQQVREQLQELLGDES